MSNLNLDPLHCADLKRSGLSADTIEAAGIKSVPPDQVIKSLGFSVPGLLSVFEIPYPDCNGFSRFRCFYEEGQSGPKYIQKKDMGNRIYIPPLIATSLNDLSEISITAGEKKALKACQEGLPCIGLAGSWNEGLIPDFDRINLRRKICLVPDNDYKSSNGHGNVNNLEAVNNFANALQERGATVVIADLPPGPEKGLDDYLLTQFVLDLPTHFHRVSTTTEDQESQPDTKTEILINIALEESELFHDADQKAYATIRRDGHRETYPLRSKGFRTWLSGRFWEHSRKGCGKQIIQDALGTIEAHAIHEGSCHPVHVRLAPHNERIYLDLGSDRFDVVEVTSTGWLILEDQNIVKFSRPPGMAALPFPTDDGSIEALKRYVNLANQDDWPLIVAFILGCLHPTGPYPNFAATGEQGSAKSTLLRVVKSVVDPSTASLRSKPRNLQDLAISANNSWILAFDNLSDIPGWLSDGLCRLSTGGGFATRTLYSDDEETIFDPKRPVMLNGIDNVIRRHDLADRAIIINLGVIPDEKRIPESEFWADFEDDAPAILGGILSAVSCALQNINTVQLTKYPRMADFAKWVTAAEPALGWEPGTFMKAYSRNRSEVISMTLDADLVGTAVIVFMDDRPAWEGTATELLNALEEAADDRTKRVHGWPKATHILSGKLRRSATALRTNGIEVTFPTRTATQKLIRIEQVGEKSVTSVIDVNNKVYDTENKTDLPMTLSSDSSVTGASSVNRKRHGGGIDDAPGKGNDASILGSVINLQKNTEDISDICKENDARDADDASSPQTFKNDDLREVTL